MAFDFPNSPTVGQQFTPAAGTTYTYNGYGWGLVGTSAVIPNYLGGLVFANNTTTPNTVLDIATGGATSDDNSTMITLLSAITKNCNAAWAVGSGNGALDSGSALAASTWYHVFLIERTDTGVVDILVSTSATVPTMPTNYSKKRRIGAIKTNASSFIIAFSQFGDEFLWRVPVTEFTSTVVYPTLTVTLAGIPIGVKVRARLRMTVYNSAGISYASVMSPEESGNTVSTTGNADAMVAFAGGYQGSNLIVRTNTSAQVVAASPGGGTTVSLSSYGWFDDRGK